MKLRKLRNIAVILSLIVLAGGVGYDLGRRELTVEWNKNKPFVTIENKYPPATRDIDFGMFWEVWDRLDKYYIDSEDLKSQQLVWGAIKGMVAAAGDPYTVFLPPKENERAKQDLAGSFEGIGAQLGMKNKRIVVVAPLKGMPAEKAGLLAGDYILEVDGEDTGGWTLPEAVNNIRGPKGTEVALTIAREGGNGTKEIAIERGTIEVPSIETEEVALDCDEKTQNGRNKIDETDRNGEGGNLVCEAVGIGECADCPRAAVLRLYRFGDRTNGEWEEAVDRVREWADNADLSGEDFAGLIFDLRNNPGGYLQSAVYVASEFVESGVVVKQREKNGSVQEYSVSRTGRLLNIPMVVLVNGGSASASEIVAGALKEHGRAELIGTTTFGKGSVQEAQDLRRGAGLHITTAKWLLPSGKSISDNGIEPDVIIENDPEEPDVDLQYGEALEELLRNSSNSRNFQ